MWAYFQFSNDATQGGSISLSFFLGVALEYIHSCSSNVVKHMQSHINLHLHRVGPNNLSVCNHLNIKEVKIYTSYCFWI